MSVLPKWRGPIPRVSTLTDTFPDSYLDLHSELRAKDPAPVASGLGLYAVGEQRPGALVQRLKQFLRPHQHLFKPAELLHIAMTGYTDARAEADFPFFRAELTRRQQELITAATASGADYPIIDDF